jgi:hypothetical protein
MSRSLLEITETEYLGGKLAEIRSDLRAARSANKLSSVPQLHRLELDVMSDLRAARATMADQQDNNENPRQRLLRETRNLRRRAEAKGAMVPASRLLEREQSILSEIDAERIETAERERLASDEGAFMGRFLAAYDAMPPALRRRLLQQLTERAA